MPAGTTRELHLGDGARAVPPIAVTGLAIALLSSLLSCGGGTGPAGTGPAGRAARLAKGEGTRRMAERLESLTRDLDPTQNRFVNGARAALLRRGIDRSTQPSQRMSLLPLYADELLRAGKIEEAIAIAESLLHPSPDAAPYAPPPVDSHDFLALCYLRLGEQENCIARHSPDSCLLPIQGGGIHTRQRGSRAAITELNGLLKTDPENLKWRWLLNIASMTLGEYPAKVPPRWLIPPRAFAAEYDVKRFYDVAPTAGLSVEGHAGGAIMDDLDGDGLLDIVVSSMGLRDQLRFFHSNGDGTFSERTEAAGLTGEVGGLNVIHADYDNDGHPDLLVLRGGWSKSGGRYPNSLLRNNGDGTFEDVTEEAGILSFHPTQTGAWGDYDNDGWLDLFIGNESSPGDPHPCELYHNNRDGTFTNRVADIGVADLGYVKGVAWGDFNNDGRQDLYISILGKDNLLLRNDGPRAPAGPGGEDWRFTNVSREAGTLGPKESFPTWFWDYDNDGWLDLFVAGYLIKGVEDTTALYLGLPTATEMPRLYHNNHDGTFSDTTHAMRLDRIALPMGANFGDLDNDGWPDCYFGTGEPDLRALMPNRLFRNAEGRFFQEVTTSADVGHIQKGHGVAFGDIDNDGDQDIFEEMGGWFESDVAHSVLYNNPGHGHHFITLRLEGRRSNRSAIGARLRVRVRNAAGGRDIYATVGSGGSFGGNSLQQEIGLGDAVAIEAIEVTWPTTGEVQLFRDAPLDSVYSIIEGETALRPVQVKRFALGSPRP